MTVNVAAVDLGASSGRVVLGRVGRETLHLEAVARFPNEPLMLLDGLHWNILELYARALEGVARAVAATHGDLASIGVDSWAVDYGMLSGGRLLGVPFHYRDEARNLGAERVHHRVRAAELYPRNGLQYLPFNTVYQLAAEPWLTEADRLLLIPDLIGYWLTGAEVAERTNASTTGLLEVTTGEWDKALMDQLGYPADLFADLVDPGTSLGPLLPHVAARVGCSDLELVSVGSHDTASAVVAVPMQGEDAAYISCGTWGLVGLELDSPVLTESARDANFTNEGGVDGRIRFLTNVMGLWLLSETLRTWGVDAADLPELLTQAAEVRQPPIFDVQDPRFLPPGDLPSRIAAWFEEQDLRAPSDRPSMVRCIVESLAQAFAEAVDSAERLAGREVRVVHVVGGGALNDLLCQATADRSHRRVLAGPVEATALGNVLVQGRAAGAVSGDLEDLRRLVARTQDLREFHPRSGRMQR